MSEADVRARFSQVLRRHWVVIAVVTVVIAAVAAAYAAARPRTFSATTTILLQPTVGNAFSVAAATNSQVTTVAMGTEAGLVDSLAVTERVNKVLGTTLQPGSADISATVPTNTQLVQITASATTAAEATRRAQTYAEAFLDYRLDRAQGTQKVQLARLTAQSVSTEKLLQQASATAALKNPPPGTGSKVQLYAGRLDSIQTDIDTLQSVSTEPGTVVTPASASHSSFASTPLLITVGGAVFGLVLGFLVALWRDRRDDRFYPADSPVVLDLPVLATVPSSRRFAKGAGPGPLDAPPNEAFRHVRVSLIATAPAPSVIAFSAVSSREACAPAVLQLARVLVEAGYRTVVVDAVIEGIRVSSLLGLEQERGLSDLTGTDEPLRGVLRDVDGIQVLLSGADPVAARERYAGSGLRDRLAALRRQADYVLVATSPLSTSDGASVALAADCVALVATDGVTTVDQISRATDLLRRLGSRVLGVLAVRPRSRAGVALRWPWAGRPQRSDSTTSGAASTMSTVAASASDNDASTAGQTGSDVEVSDERADPHADAFADAVPEQRADVVPDSPMLTPAPDSDGLAVMRARRRGRMTMRRIRSIELERPSRSGGSNGATPAPVVTDPRRPAGDPTGEVPGPNGSADPSLDREAVINARHGG